MEDIIKKVFIVGCLLTGAAVSLVAADSYADKVTGASGSTINANETTVYNLTVEKAITLDSVTGPTIDATAGQVKTGTLSATVSANTGYTISLSATAPALTSGSNTIPAVSNLSTSTGTGWSIMDKTNNNNYKAITTSPASYFTTSTAAPAGTKTDFTAGVIVAPTTPEGTYTTTVTVTAAVN